MLDYWYSAVEHFIIFNFYDNRENRGLLVFLSVAETNTSVNSQFSITSQVFLLSKHLRSQQFVQLLFR